MAKTAAESHLTKSMIMTMRWRRFLLLVLPIAKPALMFCKAATLLALMSWNEEWKRPSGKRLRVFRGSPQPSLAQVPAARLFAALAGIVFACSLTGLAALMPPAPHRGDRQYFFFIFQ